MSVNGPCAHEDQSHTVMYWVEDGGPPIPMMAKRDTLEKTLAFAHSGIKQDNVLLRWIKIYRSDNEGYTCWRWENPIPYVFDPTEDERLVDDPRNSIPERRKRWWYWS